MQYISITKDGKYMQIKNDQLSALEYWFGDEHLCNEPGCDQKDGECNCIERLENEKLKYEEWYYDDRHN